MRYDMYATHRMHITYQQRVHVISHNTGIRAWGFARTALAPPAAGSSSHAALNPGLLGGEARNAIWCGIHLFVQCSMRGGDPGLGGGERELVAGSARAARPRPVKRPCAPPPAGGAVRGSRGAPFLGARDEAEVRRREADEGLRLVMDSMIRYDMTLRSM